MATYPGGKAGDGVYQKIINLMPPHQIYIEPFLGGGAIMRLKLPAPVASIGLDVDASALDVFKGECPRRALLMVRDALQYLQQSEHCQKPGTLVYCDPPYLMETRSCKRPYYRHEFSSREDHARLLDILLGLSCMVMVSGYYSDLYAQKLSGWRTTSFNAQTRRGVAEEWVWMNFPAPLELHDYRYLGNNFRERERIKRKQLRWKKRLAGMDDQERYAMLSVLQDLRSTSPEMAISAENASIVNFDDPTR